MALPAGGYSPARSPLKTRAFQKDDQQALRTSLTAFRQRLGERQEGLVLEESETPGRCSTADDTDWTEILVPVNYGRRLVLPTSQHLQRHQIGELNRLYHAEQKFLEGAQHTVISEMLRQGDSMLEGKLFTGTERIEQFQAVHDVARR